MSSQPHKGRCLPWRGGDLCTARASHSGGAARGSLRPSARKCGPPVVSRRGPPAEQFLGMWTCRRADACAQPMFSARSRGHNTGLLLETALCEHATRGSGRRLRPPARTHGATAGTCVSAAVGEMAGEQAQRPRPPGEEALYKYPTRRVGHHPVRGLWWCGSPHTQGLRRILTLSPVPTPRPPRAPLRHATHDQSRAPLASPMRLADCPSPPGCRRRDYPGPRAYRGRRQRNAALPLLRLFGVCCCCHLCWDRVWVVFALCM